jgi:hypothetical protein
MAKKPRAKKVMDFAPAMSMVFRGVDSPMDFAKELDKLTYDDKVYFVQQLEVMGIEVRLD